MKTVNSSVTMSIADVYPSHVVLLARDNFILAEEFEGKPLPELLEPDLSGWVHHAQYILPQGRCKWINPSTNEDNLEGEGWRLDTGHVSPANNLGWSRG